MYALSVIQFPSGRFGFVGSVPTLLGYENAEDIDIAKALCHYGLSIAQKIAARRGLPVPKTRTWETREAAIRAAEVNGFAIA